MVIGTLSVYDPDFGDNVKFDIDPKDDAFKMENYQCTSVLVS